MMKMRMMIAVSILALAICASPARAALIAYEGFNYSGTDLDTQNGGTGWSGAWEGTQTLSDDDTSLAYSGNPNPVVGDRLNVLRDLFTAGAARNLSTPLPYTQDSAYYMSGLLIKISGKILMFKLQTAASGMLDFTTTAMRSGFGSQSSSPYFANIGGSLGPATNLDFGYTAGNVAFFVIKTVADPANNRWIGYANYYETPSAVPTTEPGTWMESWGGTAHANAQAAITRFQIGGNDAGSFDELRIGTTYADVVAGAAAIPGDFDADNDVDGVDFGLWQSGYPTASGADLIDGDADGDGDVDGVDFGIWQANYPTNVGGAAIIPEPATIGVLLLGGLVVALRRRR